MDPWYRVATPRKEVREGRSFNPDEFAIALEQVVAGTAPEDYRDPEKFFSRTCFTRALKEHAGMVLQRLTGKTEGAAPVLTPHHSVWRRQDAHAYHSRRRGAWVSCSIRSERIFMTDEPWLIDTNVLVHAYTVSDERREDC